MTTPRDPDVLVIGGGVVGFAVAWGLVREGLRVRLLDEGDDALRAARGNFGLVWVQGKGAGRPDYARWTMQSAADWPALAAELHERTGIDVELRQPGGLTLCLSDGELAERSAALASLRAELGGDYPFETLDAAAVHRLLPATGTEVAGAVFSPLDGHVSPLKLLRALVQAFLGGGGELVTGAAVRRVEARDGGFRAITDRASHDAGRVVLAAGLGNRALGAMLGLSVPVAPNRGQILVTERLQPFLSHPTVHVRQTGDGPVQIGDSKEDVGLDDGTTIEQLARIADRAVRQFPLLAGVNIVRTWGALRVMSPDGFPIYEQSAAHRGAFVVTCHSGITLAANHAGALARWIAGAAPPRGLAGFTSARFASCSDA